MSDRSITVYDLAQHRFPIEYDHLRQEVAGTLADEAGPVYWLNTIAFDSRPCAPDLTALMGTDDETGQKVLMFAATSALIDLGAKVLRMTSTDVPPCPRFSI